MAVGVELTVSHGDVVDHGTRARLKPGAAAAVAMMAHTQLEGAPEPAGPIIGEEGIKTTRGFYSEAARTQTPGF